MYCTPCILTNVQWTVVAITTLCRSFSDLNGVHPTLCWVSDSYYYYPCSVFMAFLFQNWTLFSFSDCFYSFTTMNVYFLHFLFMFDLYLKCQVIVNWCATFKLIATYILKGILDVSKFWTLWIVIWVYAFLKMWYVIWSAQEEDC